MNTPFDSARHVVIIGGGITGLSTAWYLTKEARQQGVDLHVTVLEGSDRWGGKIHTDAIEGYGDSPFVVEAGPDSFLTQKPWALQLACELGLENRLLNTNDHMRKTFVLKHGRMIALPDGVQLIVPTRVMPFALSPLLSPLAKLRMGMDLFIPARQDNKDETVAEFIRRRLGREALDRIAEPLMSGIYNAEAERQSLLATFPRFRAIEQEYGSLIRGMLAARKAQPNHNATAQKPAMFTSLIGGTQELVTALVKCLGTTGVVKLIDGAGVTGIVRQGEQYRITAGDAVYQADALIVTTPSYEAATLLHDLAPSAAVNLAQIRYVSTGTISLAYKRSDIRHPLNGFGVVIPRSENRPINAITWTSTKFDYRAPDGHALLRVFFGGSRNPEMMDKDDVELSHIVRSELSALMGITSTALFERIYRWHHANPQYDKEHLSRVDTIEAALPDGLCVTGSPYRGIGIPDCVHQAQQTAKKAIHFLQQRTMLA